MNKPRPQELYRHFKGNLYQIVTLAKLESTGEEMVVYQALYGDYSVYCRPLAQFASAVDGERYPAAKGMKRFTKVESVNAEDKQPAKADTPSHEAKADKVLFSSPAQGTNAYKRTGVMAKTIEEEAEDLGLDPMVVAFLDADSAGTRLQILEGLRGKATNDMIDIMAMAAGVDVQPGDPWDRFGDLRESLRTIERFETNRLR